MISYSKYQIFNIKDLKLQDFKQFLGITSKSTPEIIVVKLIINIDVN